MCRQCDTIRGREITDNWVMEGTGGELLIRRLSSITDFTVLRNPLCAHPGCAHKDRFDLNSQCTTFKRVFEQLKADRRNDGTSTIVFDCLDHRSRCAHR